MIVNICGISHKVIECEDRFDMDTHCGLIDYVNAEIKINKNMNDEIKKETIMHEMLHGMLAHLGYEQAEDEQFVNALSNAMYQGFEIKEIKKC